MNQMVYKKSIYKRGEGEEGYLLRTKKGEGPRPEGWISLVISQCQHMSVSSARIYTLHTLVHSFTVVRTLE